MTRPAQKRKSRGRPQGALVGIGRDGLIEVAKEILQTTDPSIVTRLMIAERAGVDPNLIRYYFGTMHHLIAEVIADTHRKTRQDMSAMRNLDKPLERLRFRIERLLDLFTDNPNHHKMVIATLYNKASSSEHLEWVSILEESLDDLQEIIDVGAEQGVLRKVNSRLLHLLIIGATEFFANNEPVIRILFGTDATLKEIKFVYREFLVDFISRGLAPDTAA